MSSTVDGLSAYTRAWSRHSVFVTLASRDACVRSGLEPGAEAALFGATLAELSADGTLRRPSCAAGAVDVIVEDDTLIYRYPYEHPDRARRGEVNDGFLRPERFVDRLAAALESLESVRLVVLRPAPLYKTEEIAFGDFLDRLDRLLGMLPPSYRYALEPAGPICIRHEYFACLRARGVAHVFSEGESLLRPLPTVVDQLALPGAFGGSFCVVRATPDNAVPGMRWPVPDVALRRQGWCDAARRCLAGHVPLYLMADDETDPLGAVMGFMEMMNEELAKRSIIRCNAA